MDCISENEENFEFSIPVKNRVLMDDGCGSEQWRTVHKPDRKRQHVSTSSVDNETFITLSSDDKLNVLFNKLNVNLNKLESLESKQ